MLDEASQFGAIDLGSSLGINFLATRYAVKNPSFRLSLENKDIDVPPVADLRFLGGAVSVMLSQFYAGDHPLLRRVGHDVGLGLLSSFVATETCRAAAVKRMHEAQAEGEDEGSVNLIEEDSPSIDQQESPSQTISEISYPYGW